MSSDLTIIIIIEQGWAKYCDFSAGEQVNYLSKLKTEANNWNTRCWQIPTFCSTCSIIVLSVNHHFFDQLNMSKHSLPARGTDPPFSHKSVVSITHEQNIICRKTLIGRQWFAGHVVSPWPMKKKEKIQRMIKWFICWIVLSNH